MSEPRNRAGGYGFQHIEWKERRWEHAEEFIETLDLVLSRKVEKGLKKLPEHVVDKLLEWVSSVESAWRNTEAARLP